MHIQIFLSFNLRLVIGVVDQLRARKAISWLIAVHIMMYHIYSHTGTCIGFTGE